MKLNHDKGIIKKLIIGRKKPLVLYSFGILALTVFFCIISSFIIKTQNITAEKLKELYGVWQVAEFESLNFQKDNSWHLHRKALALNESNNVVGAVGTVPERFFTENNISLISGRLPEKDNEIAVSLSVLDALGKSYETAQTIDLKWIDTEESSETNINSFLVSGILPSYDCYWYTGGVNLINIICSNDCTIFSSDQSQSFFYNLSDEQMEQYRNLQSDHLIVNEYAYPEDYDTDYSFLGLYSFFAVLSGLLALFLNYIFTKSLGNALRTMYLLGASKSKLRLIRHKIILLPDTLIILGSVFGHLIIKLFNGAVPELSWKALLIAATVFALIHIVFYIQFTIVTEKQENTCNTQKAQRFTVASELQLREKVLIGILFLTASLTVTAADWQMLKYEINKPYTAMNIQADKEMSKGILLKLSAIPYVAETASYYFDPSAYRVTSNEMKEDPVLKEVLDNPVYLMRYEDGVAGMQIMVIPEKEIQSFWNTYELDEKSQNDFLNGTGIVCYLPGYVIQDSGNIEYSYTDSDITSIDTGNTVSVDDRSVKIVGMIKRFQPKSLITNNEVFIPGTLIVSEKFYSMLNPEYSGEITRVNLRLEDNTPDSVRRSVSAIAVQSGARLNSDTYSMVSQIYEQASFTAWVIISSGLLILAVSVLLLTHTEYMKNEIEKNRIGILRSLGASKKQLMKAYYQRNTAIILCSSVVSLLINYGIVFFMNHGEARGRIIQLLRCNVLVNVEWNFKWLLEVSLIAVIAVIVFILMRTSYAQYLTHEPYENLEDMENEYY